MIILGIDPGTARIGWGVIDTTKSTIKTLAFGCFETKKEEKAEVRLSQVYDAMTILCKKYRPDAMSIEQLFFATNAKTAMGVGQSRGVILLVAAQHKIPPFSYSPLSVKRWITGSGKSDKKIVRQEVVKLLKLKKIPKLDDTADALAIALLHAYSLSGKAKISSIIQ